MTKHLTPLSVIDTIAMLGLMNITLCCTAQKVPHSNIDDIYLPDKQSIGQPHQIPV